MVKSRGRTALMHAVEAKDLTSVSTLIAQGANVNQKDELGMSALMLAVMNGDYETAELLVKNGADVNAAKKNSHTVLICAVFNQQRLWHALVHHRT
ncbi:MAG TPA: ankyrin repeat domain-containing protein, partial [Candidatus Wallbacteria bacterium]|nr:ankyrin repeat domain-containing protein [Candidatus Wallbacteria bacterium]